MRNMLSENAKNRWVKDFENGVSLSFAPDSVKDNRELVMAAVCLNGMNLQFASERLQNDIDVVEAAINQNVHALQFASGDLQYQFMQGGFNRFHELKKQMITETNDEESEKNFKKLYNELINLIYEEKRISEDMLNVQAKMLNLYPDESLSLFEILKNLDDIQGHNKTK